MQTVRNLLESLARFSPDAIVEPEIELLLEELPRDMPV